MNERTDGWTAGWPIVLCHSFSSSFLYRAYSLNIRRFSNRWRRREERRRSKGRIDNISGVEADAPWPSLTLPKRNDSRHDLRASFRTLCDLLTINVDDFYFPKRKSFPKRGKTIPISFLFRANQFFKNSFCRQVKPSVIRERQDNCLSISRGINRLRN